MCNAFAVLLVSLILSWNYYSCKIRLM